MAEAFTIHSNQQILTTPVTGNGSFIIDQSATQQNTTPIAYVGMSLNVQASNFSPDPEATNANWELCAAIESGDGVGNFWPIAHMFAPIKRGNLFAQHVVIVSPQVFNINEGVPVDIFANNQVVTRISRQQDILGQEWRVRTSLVETDFGGPSALQSFDLTMTGTLFNV